MCSHFYKTLGFREIEGSKEYGRGVVKEKRGEDAQPFPRTFKGGNKLLSEGGR